ncbi:MAG: C-GCAxxG-C-C family (seleno)protein [Anaerolineae bacterium]
MQKQVVIWGAGKIGRGFLARLFDQAGYKIFFVEQDRSLVEMLRRAGHYPLRLVEAGKEEREITIRDFQIFHVDEKDEIARLVAASPLVAVAVHPEAFPAVAARLAEGILLRARQNPDAPLDIILCANILHPGPHLRALLEEATPAEGQSYLQEKVGVVESLVICMAPEVPAEFKAESPLLVMTDGYPELMLERSAFRGAFPEGQWFRPVEDMHAEEVRKLYTYNMAHAALAYLGVLHGHEWAVEALRDPEVRAHVAGALDEVGEALCREFGFAKEEMAAWNESVLRRTDNPALRDRLERMGAGPERKMRRNDRLVGAALLARRHGIIPYHITWGIAAALLWDSEQVRNAIEREGPEDAIRHFSGLGKEETDLIELIMRAYETLHKAQKAYRLGFEYEKRYHGCGQCALAAILDALGRREDDLFKSATALCAGIGLLGDGVCGGYAAGAMAIGLYLGRRRDHFDGDREEKYRAFEMTRQLHDRFIASYGSVICNEIHKKLFGRTFDLQDSAERELFEEMGAHVDKCTEVVGRAAQWTVEILSETPLQNEPFGL